MTSQPDLAALRSMNLWVISENLVCCLAVAAFTWTNI